MSLALYRVPDGPHNKGQSNSPCPSVYSPAAALRSLSSVALSSAPANQTLSLLSTETAILLHFSPTLSSTFLREATNHISSTFLREATGARSSVREMLFLANKRAAFSLYFQRRKAALVGALVVAASRFPSPRERASLGQTYPCQNKPPRRVFPFA
jgi:hypothetical protein